MPEENNVDRRRFISAAAMAAASLGLGALDWENIPYNEELVSLKRATGWLNSQPLTAARLRGKVVLVEFWTYTCINWLRTLPYVRAWAQKYREQGLVVVGVHAPEFEFEHSLDNVRRAAKDLGVDYPIAIDNNYVIWRAFHNEYWPALYMVDAKGHVRHHQFGEGDYEHSEKVIQQLLAEAGVGGIRPEFVAVDARGVEASADLEDLNSAENYVGYDRTQNFASPGGAVLDKSRMYAAPARLELNQWGFSVIGRSENKPSCSTRRMDGFCIAFTLVICIS